MSVSATRLGELSSVKLALMAKRVRSEAQAVLRADPIAIVGMSCRAPGAASPAAFWRLLCSGKDAVRSVPSDRWDGDAWFDADPSVPGKAITKEGGFLDRVDGFDAAYFGILPREAERMDPQQRVFLEVAIEALDDAGQLRERLRGSRSGVFVSSYQNDYERLAYADLDAIDERTLTGTLHSVLANRLSYLLDLRGPSLSIDTACSSSLVAVHLACQSLRTGECDLALAGGVSLMITPGLMVSLSKVGFMAPDGRCKTFDASADGFGRGEGCGVVVLKRLADAIADDDRVLAVIRGSAVNQDGRSTVLAAPNGLAQRDLILEALANAELDPGQIGVIEAHGTGTPLGDPIEVEALATTVGRAEAARSPCFLTGAKAWLGHLEAAAGVMGLIKLVLTLEHGAVPGQANFSALNPHISLAGTRLTIPKELTPWPRGSTRRCAAVSAFGVGGTNAHVIVEESPALPASPEPTAGTAGILPLSAASPGALRALAASWLSFLDETRAPLHDLCYSAARRRSHYDFRLAVAATDAASLKERLAERVAALEAAPETTTSGERPRVGFVFSGQGPQWYAMGRELMTEEPLFRAAIDECDALLAPRSGWSLRAELAASESESRLGRTDVAQPALFALQVALARLWQAWGLAPEGVVGHSVGEIAALHVAGVLSLEEAVRIVFERGRIMQEATGLGCMAQVTLSAAEATERLRPWGDRVSLAAMNGPRSVVFSGERAALEQLLGELAKEGVGHRMLPVNYAFHSAQMAPFEERLRQALGSVTAAAPRLAVYSTVTGARADTERFDAAYFGRNVRAPVRFESAVRALAADGANVFVEVAPHPVLSAAVTESIDAAGRSARVVASLRRGRAERETMLEAAARLYEAGWSPAWNKLQRSGALTALPPYAWQRKRYWIRTRENAPRAAASGHPLLGGGTVVAGSGVRVFDVTAAAPWLADHRVFDRVIVPGAALAELLFAAAASALGATPELGGFAIERPLHVPDAGSPAPRLQVVITPGEPGRAELFEEWTASGAGRETAWRSIASATVLAARTAPSLALPPLEANATKLDVSAVYARFRELGVEFGPSFRLLDEVRTSAGAAEARVVPPPDLEAGYALHPVVLDAALQLCSLAAGPDAGGSRPARVLLPLGADSLRILGRADGDLFARARVRETGQSGSLNADVVLESRSGAGATQVAVIEGMRFAPADASAFARPAEQAEDLYRVEWQAEVDAPSNGGVAGARTWLLLLDRGGVGEALARTLEGTGATCRRVVTGAAYASPPGGPFVVDPANPEHFKRLLADAGGSLGGIVHLFGLDVPPLDGEVAERVTSEDALDVGSALHLVQAASASSGCPLWFVTRGACSVSGSESELRAAPRAAGLWGFASVAALEHPELEISTLDLDPDAEDAPNTAALHAKLTQATPKRSRALAWRGERFWAPRLKRPAPLVVHSEPLRVEVARPGSVEGLAFERRARKPLQPGEARLRVLATGVNFRDVLTTLGMYPGASAPLGVECAGVVTEVLAPAGDLELGMLAFGFAPGSLGSEVTAPAAHLAPVPAGMSPERAAALPVAYLTAYYGFHRLARLERGQRVLIHAAAGGVGLAAVELARRAGAEIFATAGSARKRAFLAARGVKHVLDSRSLEFADRIDELTRGEGVHVVLNSLSGDFIAASLRVVAKGGCFLELGKRGVMTPDDAARARPDVRYHLYDLGSEAEADHTLLRPMLNDVLGALAAGEIRPLPVRAFPLERAGEAFRYMAQAKHIGKLVVKAPRQKNDALVTSDATYWITGGLGGLGLETARWLAGIGARHLLLSGRHAPNARASAVIAELEQRGVTVRAVAVDAADRAGMQATLERVGREMPPLRGVVHSAGALDDGPIVLQTWARCAEVLRGKAQGAFVLHELTRELDLDFFVLYSAAGLLLGAPGQCAYAAANAELDALAHARQRVGLPALSVAWGAWGEVGMLAELAKRGPDVWAARGLGNLARTVAFDRLERLLRENATHAAVLTIDWRVFLERLPAGADAAFFSELAPREKETPRAAATTNGLRGTLEKLPFGQRRPSLVGELARHARRVIGLASEAVLDPGQALKDSGLDSLMAVELRNALARASGRPLPATLLFDYPTLDALADHLLGVLELRQAPERPADTAKPSATAAAAERELAELTDEQAEALLLAELDATARNTHDG